MTPTWDVLVRHYLARRDKELLEQAIGAVQHPDIGTILGLFAQGAAQEVDHRAQVLFQVLTDAGRRSEAATAWLLALDMRSQLTESYIQFPLEHQMEALRIGLDACSEAVVLAGLLNDTPCVARYRVAQAIGLYNKQEWEMAVQMFEVALDHYRHLAAIEPAIYTPYLAITLNNLGSTLRDMAKLDSAIIVFKEALDCYRRLAESQPAANLPNVAMVLTNLGTVLHDIRNMEAARMALEEALGCYRLLAESQSAAYIPLVATVLNALGNVWKGLREMEAARRAFGEALGYYRYLVESQPDVYLRDVAMVLHNFGATLVGLREMEAARQAFEEALGYCRYLAQSQPDIYLLDVAMNLNGLGNVLSYLRELEDSRRVLEEALDIRRRLADKQPDIYLSDVAMTLGNLGRVLEELHELEPARQAFEETLGYHRNMAKRQPNVNLQDVAATLNSLGSVLSKSSELVQARLAFEEALRYYRHLAEIEPSIYVSDVAISLNNLGNVLANLKEWNAACSAYEEAVALQDSNGLWLDSANTHYNWGGLEQYTNPADTETIRKHYRACVERCERGLRQLQESKHRDKFKGKIEYAYIWLIEEEARLAQENNWESCTELLGLLEAVRQIETLASLKIAPDSDGEPVQMEAASLDEEIASLLRVHDVALVWIQATPKALVFMMLTLEDGFQVVLADRALLHGMRALEDALRHAIEIRSEALRAPAHEVATMNVLTAPVDKEAQQIYLVMPDMLKTLLARRKERPIFLLSCSATVNLPWELIQLPTVDGWEYLGLQRNLTRLHSVRDLNNILQRQPWSSTSPRAVVVGDPNHDLRHSYDVAEDLATLLNERGFELAPSGDALLRSDATMEALESALEQEFTLWLQLSHGGGDKTNLYLSLANGRLYAQTIAVRHWPQHPIVHYAACYTGMTLYEGGGRFSGHPTGALLAGASCVLSSVTPLFDAADAEFCRRLYSKVLNKTKPRTFGEALLATRREIAAEYDGNPLVWAQYALWGNPSARLMAR